MKKFFKLTLVVCASALLFSACKTQEMKAREEAEQKIYVVSINDMHANIDNFPQMAALIDSLRTMHPDLLLFGAGDNRSAIPSTTDATKLDARCAN